MTTFVGTPEIIVASICAVIGFLLVRECWRYWQENREPPEPEMVDCPRCGGSGFSGYGTGYGDVCDECGGQRRLQAEDMPHWWDKISEPPPATWGVEARLPVDGGKPTMVFTRRAMRNRYMSEDADSVRSEAMADQILADQHLGLERPGQQTHAPAPGEPGYSAPSQPLVVRAGVFEVSFPRGGGEATIREDGAAVAFPYTMPSEWTEVLSAFALDLALVRREKGAVRRAVLERYGPEDLYWIDEMAKNDQR